MTPPRDPALFAKGPARDSRFAVVEELTVLTAYRQCKVNYFPFIDDFTARFFKLVQQSVSDQDRETQQ